MRRREREEREERQRETEREREREREADTESERKDVDNKMNCTFMHMILKLGGGRERKEGAIVRGEGGVGCTSECKSVYSLLST